MKTTSIILQPLSVPCECRCRYCLLSWDGHPVGAEYGRCKDYAMGFYRFAKQHLPFIDFHFTFGYSIDYPQPLEEPAFLNSIGSVQGRFLQLDGMKLYDVTDERYCGSRRF